jgi:hypothetical protein
VSIDSSIFIPFFILCTMTSSWIIYLSFFFQLFRITIPPMVRMQHSLPKPTITLLLLCYSRTKFPKFYGRDRTAKKLKCVKTMVFKQKRVVKKVCVYSSDFVEYFLKATKKANGVIPQTLIWSIKQLGE